MSSSSTASRLAAVLGAPEAKRTVGRIAGGASDVHAVLLYGAEGSANEPLADVLAQAWMCLEPTPEGACGACRACGAFGRGRASDLLTIAPGGPSHMIVKRQISAPDKPERDDPVPLSEFVLTPPLSARRKVVRIVEAHRMQTSYNALLKMLEEPLPHLRFVLTAPSTGALPPTIVSRCIGVACSLPEEAELRAAFPDATDDDLRLSEGAPGRLARILAHREVYRDLAAFARRLARKRPTEAMALSDEFRALCDRLTDVVPGGARGAQAEALGALALWLAREPGVPPGRSQAVVAAHRKILGNAAAGLQFDALFARMLG